MFVRLLKFGRGFKGALEYQLGAQSDKPHTILGGNVHGEIDDIKAAFYREASLRPDVEEPVMHLFTSWHPDDKPTDEQMREVAERMLSAIDFDTEKHQYLIVRHHDTAHQHFHILANRVAEDGSVFVSKNWPAKRLRAEADALDAEYGFTPVGAAHRKDIDIEDAPIGRDPSPDVSRLEQRTGTKSAKNEVYQGVRKALKASDGSLASYDQELRKLGISPSWSFTKDGQFNGASYTLLQPGRAVAATNDRGESYTFKGSQIRWSKTDLEEAMAKHAAMTEGKGKQGASHQSDTSRAEAVDDRERARILASMTNLSRTLLGTHSGTGKRNGAAYQRRMKRSVVQSLLPLFQIKTRMKPIPTLPIQRKR